MLSIADESFHQWQLFAGLLDLQHAVEAGVANHYCILDADRSQQELTLLILHEEGCETRQHTGIIAAVPLEEDLVPSEDARNAIGGHTPMLQHVKVVVPEFVFDEECHHRPYRTQEPAGIVHCVQWQVADDVGSLVILSHFIARRREKGEQNLVFGVSGTNSLHQRASLLKLPK